MAQRLLVLLAESPVHAGGAAAEGALDLPIQREAATGLPVIWGQSLKGALRDRAVKDRQDWVVTVFGERLPDREPDTAPTRQARPTDHGRDLTKGEVSFGDAALLAFPAATLHNTFAWTTSRMLLSRLARKILLLGADLTPLLDPLTGLPGVAGGPGWPAKPTLIGPFVHTVTEEHPVTSLATVLAALACPASPAFEFTRTKLTADLLVLPDDMLSELTKLATDTVARVQLREQEKTVANGPFYSEHLPTETVLTALLSGEEQSLRHLDSFDGTAIQLGGDETIGKGVMWCRVHQPAAVASIIAPHTPATVG